MSKTAMHTDMQSEQQYLERTIAAAHKQWQNAKKKLIGEQEEIATAFEEMLENATHDLMGLDSEQGFHNLANLSQYIMPFTTQMTAHDTGTNTIKALEGMMDCPYFARIDFLYEGEDTAEKIYIGRITLMDQDTLTIHVHDWRTPVASVFYRYGVGKASYQAPGGEIFGEVLLKRQFEIKQGCLQYFFDADVQILDDFLRQLLSKHTSPKMKAIVETIQRDQDIVIRDMENDVLLVQGAAGSGKTSIALHRIAYLMYQGLNGHLDANDILILSPNPVFEEYISQVLPDLGEKNVKTMLFDDLFHSILPDIKLRSKSQFIEDLLSCEDRQRSAIIKNSAEFKGSVVFTELLNRVVKDLPRRWLQFQDINYNGQCIAHRDKLKSSICCSPKMAPLGVRLKWLEQDIFEKVHAIHENRMQKLRRFAARFPQHTMELEAFSRWLSIRESAVLLNEVRKFTYIDSFHIYRDLFRDKDRFYRLSKGLSLPDNIEEIRCFTLNRLCDDVLWHDDAQALLYLHLRIYGNGEYLHYRQVVLDEAQDETPLYFAILHELFTGARYTILGDVNQTIGKQADLTLYGQIEKILGKERSYLVTMEKSFRCTMEIWQFSARFLPEGMLGQCFSRNGDEPGTLFAQEVSQMDDLMIREVVACKERGYHSIGIICKTEQDALFLYSRLKEKLDMQLIQIGTSKKVQGVVIIPIYLAKGLEFDAVLVGDADEVHYNTEDDKRLLYIASTRALHRLNFFHTGKVSPLMQLPALEGRIFFGHT